MQPIISRGVMSEITDFLATNPTPHEIIAYQFSDELQNRLTDLLERNGEGELTQAERNELFDFVHVEEMMSLLQAKMRLKLKQERE